MWNKKITYRKARPVLFYLMNEDEVLFLKHGFDKPLKEACVKEFYVLPFARR